MEVCHQLAAVAHIGELGAKQEFEAKAGGSAGNRAGF
jgi:hypothetical protein